VNKLSWQ